MVVTVHLLLLLSEAIFGAHFGRTTPVWLAKSDKNARNALSNSTIHRLKSAGERATQHHQRKERARARACGHACVALGRRGGGEP